MELALELAAAIAVVTATDSYLATIKFPRMGLREVTRWALIGPGVCRDSAQGHSLHRRV